MNPTEGIDQQWEYLSNYTKPYTIDLTQQYANVCALAVNSNIIHFHSDINTLSMHLETVLSAIQQVSAAVVTLSSRHEGKTGLATTPDDVQAFMNISEEYVLLQHQMLSVLESVNYITESSNIAHQRATAAANNNQPDGTHNGTQ